MGTNFSSMPLPFFFLRDERRAVGILNKRSGRTARERTARVDRGSLERGTEGGDTWHREEEADSRESDRPGRGPEDPAEDRGG